MTCGGGHGVIDGDDGERAHACAALLHFVELGDFFIERAAGEGDAEGTLFEFARFFLET